MSKATFIQHYVADQRFITDIWLHETEKKYRSVVSDVYIPKGFNTLEEIVEYLNKLQEVK